MGRVAFTIFKNKKITQNNKKVVIILFKCALKVLY